MDKPSGLKAKGSALWDSVVPAYELKSDEFRVLESACRTLDEITRLERALATAPVMVVGSRGQEIANPLFGEVARHRALLARLVKQLDLPYPDAKPGRSALSEKRAAAANTRWARVRAAREAEL